MVMAVLLKIRCRQPQKLHRSRWWPPTIRSLEAFAHAGLWLKVLGLLTEMPRLALRPSADAVQVGIGWEGHIRLEGPGSDDHDDCWSSRAATCFQFNYWRCFSNFGPKSCSPAVHPYGQPHTQPRGRLRCCRARCRWRRLRRRQRHRTTAALWRAALHAAWPGHARQVVEKSEEPTNSWSLSIFIHLYSSLSLWASQKAGHVVCHRIHRP